MNMNMALCIIILNFSSFVFSIDSRAYFGLAIRAKIVQLIRNEKKCIKVAMYTFTDFEIAQALVHAYKRDIRIECIVDGFTNRIPSGKGFYLRAKGIPVMQYDPDNYKSLMHSKYMIFSETEVFNNYVSAPCVVSGSYNCTYNAAFNNFENMVVIPNNKIVIKFCENFREIKQESFYLSEELAKRRELLAKR